MPAGEFFTKLEQHATPDAIAGIQNAIVFDIEGEGRWLVDIRDGKLAVTENWAGGGDAVISASSQTFDRIAARKQNPMTAYMTGKVKIAGDLGAVLKLQKLF